jgi:hypothetical protein
LRGATIFSRFSRHCAASSALAGKAALGTEATNPRKALRRARARASEVADSSICLRIEIIQTTYRLESAIVAGEPAEELMRGSRSVPAFLPPSAGPIADEDLIGFH